MTQTFKKHHLFLASRYLAPESSLQQCRWWRSGGHRLRPAPSRDIVASVNMRHVCPTNEWAELIVFFQRERAALSGTEPTMPTAHKALPRSCGRGVCERPSASPPGSELPASSSYPCKQLTLLPSRHRVPPTGLPLPRGFHGPFPSTSGRHSM